jgi:peptidoglycan/xylan/chitin deacetylase (PgdA/CDA1 family)
MFFDQDIKGMDLPPRTLCLTYDDGPGEEDGEGPGPHTEKIGQFLWHQGVAATFFVVGRFAEEHPRLLRRLAEWGHLVGNHTYSHPGLVDVATAGGDVVSEITRADDVIAGHVISDVTFLRAPYGYWRERIEPGGMDRPTSIVAAKLNACPRLGHYVGPVNWDISVADYDFWKRGDSAEACAAAYLAKIERLGRGIILMHDGSEDPAVRANNRALQTTRLIVPELKSRGYRFVRLDAVPQARAAIRLSRAMRHDHAEVTRPIG